MKTEILNTVSLAGNVGTARTATIQGRELVSFSLATTHIYHDRSGQTVCETTWHRCVAFSGAKGVQHLDKVAKGARVVLEGRLVPDGEHFPYVRVDSLHVLGEEDDIQEMKNEIVLTGPVSNLREMTGGSVRAFGFRMPLSQDPDTGISVTAYASPKTVCLADIVDGQGVSVRGRIRQLRYISEYGEERSGFTISAEEVNPL